MQRVSKGFYVPCRGRIGLKCFILESRTNREKHEKDGQGRRGQAEQRRGGERRGEQGKEEKERSSDYFF